MLDATPDKLEVLVPRYGIEATVYLCAKGADATAVPDDAGGVAWTTAAGAAVAVAPLDAVVVRISMAPPANAAEDVGSVVVALVDPPPPAADADAAPPPPKKRKVAARP